MFKTRSDDCTVGPGRRTGPSLNQAQKWSRLAAGTYSIFGAEGRGARRAVLLSTKKGDELFHSASTDLDACTILEDHCAVAANQMLQLLHRIEVHDGGS
jgi:hypothetical protein